VPRDAWSGVHVADVMTPAARVVTVTQYEDGADALDKLSKIDVSQLPVVDSGQRLVGMLRLRDLHRFIELHAQSRPRYVHH
jgi:CBS domain containing-hemolysin-like protein